MWEPTMLTQIDTVVAELTLEEFHKNISMQDGSVVDYKGHLLVEDETIVGNSDKCIFFAKELIADLSTKYNHLLEPFVVAKLDFQTIKFFKFPKIEKSLNKYTMRKQGIAGYDYLMKADMEAITSMAKDKVRADDEVAGGKIGGNVQDVLNRRNIKVPSLL